MIEYCSHNLMKNECIFCLIENSELNSIKNEKWKLFFKMWLNSKYGNFENKKMIKTNQAIKHLKDNRENMIKALKYLENIGNTVISIDMNGNFYCLNDLDNLYNVSMKTIKSMMERQEYSRKEKQYSDLVKLNCNLLYLDDIKKNLRKIKCILSRIKLKIKELIKRNVIKKRFKKRNSRKFQLFDVLDVIRLYGK